MKAPASNARAGLARDAAEFRARIESIKGVLAAPSRNTCTGRAHQVAEFHARIESIKRALAAPRGAVA